MVPFQDSILKRGWKTGGGGGQWGEVSGVGGAEREGEHYKIWNLEQTLNESKIQICPYLCFHSPCMFIRNNFTILTHAATAGASCL